MANNEDEWGQILRKNIRLFNGKVWNIRGIKFGKLKKLQITHKIDDGLQHENPREPILTSNEFVQQNSPNIQTLIKDKIIFITLLKKELIKIHIQLMLKLQQFWMIKLKIKIDRQEQLSNNW